VPGSDPVFEPALRDTLPSRSALAAGAGHNGRHAAAATDDGPGTGRSGSSWHDALWSREGRDRFKGEHRSADDAAPTIPIPDDTSQVVSRLAQLLRENPTLAANWSREAPE
jgi:hypothetical protein